MKNELPCYHICAEPVRTEVFRICVPLTALEEWAYQDTTQQIGDLMEQYGFTLCFRQILQCLNVINMHKDLDELPNVTTKDAKIFFEWQRPKEVVRLKFCRVTKASVETVKETIPLS